MRRPAARALSLSKGLALPLALVTTFAAALTACSNYADYHPGMHAVPRLDVRTVPTTTPRPGDTLTFYALFPDSTSPRYLIAWDCDRRGRAIPSGCTRGVCTKWIVPAGRGTYNHAVQVASDDGVSGIPFTTVVP